MCIPKGLYSKVPKLYDMGVLGTDGQETTVVTRMFLRNCQVLMPLLREHENFMCVKYLHDFR